MKILRKLRSLLTTFLLVAALSAGVLAQSGELKQAIEKLQDIDPAVRMQAVFTIVNSASGAQDAVEPLFECLKNDPDPDIQKLALAAFSELAKKSDNPQAILNKVRTVLASDDLALAITAVGVLEEFPNDPSFKTEAEKRFALLKKGLESPEAVTSELTIVVLGLSKDPRAEKTLIDLLQQPDHRRSAASSLAGIKTKSSKEALLAFARKALASSDSEEQEIGLSVVDSVDGAATALESELAQLASQDSVNGANAASRYYALKPQAALPLLRKALTSSNPEIRRVGIYAVSMIRGADSRALEDDIAQLFKSSTDDEELQIILQLVSMQEPVSLKYFDSVVAQTGSSSALVRTAATDVLSKFGPESKRSLPTLTKLLSDKEPEIQIKSAIAIYMVTGDYSLVQKTFDSIIKDPASVALALNYSYLLENTPIQRKLLEALKTQAMAGDATSLNTLSLQNFELDPQLLKLYNSRFDVLDSSARVSLLSRLSMMHPARDGVVTFIRKCLEASGDERWTAANVYVRLTGDRPAIHRILAEGLASTEDVAISSAISTLAGDDELVRHFAAELESVATGKTELYIRQYAVNLLIQSDSERAAAAVVKLLRDGEFWAYSYGDTKFYEALSQKLTPADRDKLVSIYLALVKEPKSWYEKESDFLAFFSLFTYSTGWPPSLIPAITEIEKNHPSLHIREYAAKAREKQVNP